MVTGGEKSTQIAHQVNTSPFLFHQIQPLSGHLKQNSGEKSTDVTTSLKHTTTATG